MKFSDAIAKYIKDPNNLAELTATFKNVSIKFTVQHSSARNIAEDATIIEFKIPPGCFDPIIEVECLATASNKYVTAGKLHKVYMPYTNANLDSKIEDICELEIQDRKSVV